MKSAVLNAGDTAWIFEEHANMMAAAFGVPVVDSLDGIDLGTYPPSRTLKGTGVVYLLAWEQPEPPAGVELFIPFDGARIASDKRLIAEAFAKGNVPSPETYLIETKAEVVDFLLARPDRRWVLKWPIGCGASGHRLIDPDNIPDDEWPKPYVVQEFVEMANPEVYRLYCVDGDTFGWNRRRFQAGKAKSPWVAHAQGAFYDGAGDIPGEAVDVALAALRACHLADSFGCVDLLPSPRGWLALEVGTDGLYTYVDRDIVIDGRNDTTPEITRRIAAAFLKRMS